MSKDQHLHCELDLHADTCSAGINFIANEHTGQTFSVYGFDDDVAHFLQNIPIDTCMSAHTLPDVETLIVVAQQALYMERNHSDSLPCLNQSCCNDVRVDDFP